MNISNSIVVAGSSCIKKSDLERLISQGRRRVVIENVKPEIDGGRYPVKRVLGETVEVSADMFTDGHDAIACQLYYRKANEKKWRIQHMEHLDNDRWNAFFRVEETGCYEYTLAGWVDAFGTWRRDLKKKVDADQDVSVELLTGAVLIEKTMTLALKADKAMLQQWAAKLRAETDITKRYVYAREEELFLLMSQYQDRAIITRYEKQLTVSVDRERARYSTWYELFPRSCSSEPGQHGSFADCEKRLQYIANMGFDVLYLPPIFPIGESHRKGKNNTVNAQTDDTGSPWAIGSSDGGHKSIHSELGTLKDFRQLIKKVRGHNMEVALDMAFQCSPDHPYVKQHPEWFYWRPDGTVQYAENPPKKYQDIYPLAFDSTNWQSLWEELKSVVVFWIEQGINIFRVDNPHTKPFGFWEWLINEIKLNYPDVLFLAEAFTRPKIMKNLAKLGFTQSYTYFTWRNDKQELTEYFTELCQTESHEYFRPNLWPNTPDILHESLQTGGRPEFIVRYLLAATLGSSYGIYGPAFELIEHQPVKPDSEEYLDSEKYQIRNWDLNRADSLSPLITRVNQIRHQHNALKSDQNLLFHTIDNSQLIAYSKHSDDHKNIILVIINLDIINIQTGWLSISLELLKIDKASPFEVHDLLTDALYTWQGETNYVALSPHDQPAHIFHIHQDIVAESDLSQIIS